MKGIASDEDEDAEGGKEGEGKEEGAAKAEDAQEEESGSEEESDEDDVRMIFIILCIHYIFYPFLTAFKTSTPSIYFTYYLHFYWLYVFINVLFFKYYLKLLLYVMYSYLSPNIVQNVFSLYEHLWTEFLLWKRVYYKVYYQYQTLFQRKLIKYRSFTTALPTAFRWSCGKEWCVD